MQTHATRERGRVAGLKRTVLLLALAGSIGVTTGCTQVVDQILEVGPGSSVTLTIADTDLTSDQVGGIESTVELQISFFDVLFNLPLDGTVTINDILIAGTPLTIGPNSTGTLCTSPLDPNDAGGGTIEINLKRRKLTLETASLTGVEATDPVIGPVLGVLELPVEISAMQPVNLLDLLGALGGKGLPLDITQEFEFTIEEGPLTGAVVSGVLNLTSTDTFPTDPLITECENFLAGP